MGKVTPKRESDFYKMLVDVLNDDSTSMTEEYVDKVEALIKEHIELHIKPQLEGTEKLAKCSFNKNAITKADLEKDKIILGTTSEKPEARLILGYLYSVPTYSETRFKEMRNRLVMHMITSADHEYRHTFQVLFAKECRKKHPNKKKLELFVKMFGQDKAIDIVHSINDHYNKEPYFGAEKFLKFLSEAYPQERGDFQKIMDELKKGMAFYYVSDHEMDAREAERAALVKLVELVKNGVGAVLADHAPSEKAVEKLGKLPMKYVGKGKADGSVNQLVRDVKGLARGLAEASAEAKKMGIKMEGGIEGMLKGINAANDVIDTFLRNTMQEIEVLDNQMDLVEFVREMMRGFSPAEIVAYAQQTRVNERSEGEFALKLLELSEVPIIKQFFGKKENIEETIKQLEEAGLDSAARAVKLMPVLLDAENWLE